MSSKRRAGRLISDDEDSGEEIEVIIISDDEEQHEEEAAGPPEYSRVHTGYKYVPFDDGEYAWWEKLLAPVPEAQQCTIDNCKVAPPGHKKHEIIGRNYSVFELKTVIQYLVHFDKIRFGKGLKVYDQMHDDGYMTHRTIQSLHTNFKKIILRDIRQFNLPEDIEAQFMRLIPRYRKYVAFDPANEKPVQAKYL